MFEIVVAIVAYLVIQTFLVGLIIAAKRKLLPGGDLTIVVNGEKKLTVPPGGKLLTALADQGIFLSSACGGGGSCAQCRATVKSGGGAILPTERSHINRREAREGVRLACQVPVKRDMEIEVPPEMLETKKWRCVVESNHHIATFIKELVLKLPPGEEVDFKPGGYIQIEIPPYVLSFSDFDIAEKFLGDWTRFKLFQYMSKVHQPVTRAYSMANYPGEKGMLKLNVRLATPPLDEEEVNPTPPGKASSYIFNLKPGDEVTISGPYGEFFIREGESEMVYVGAGAGMAPLRSHIFELLKGRQSKRKISFWYGGRCLREVFYLNDFEQLAREFPNFSFHLSLSRPRPEDNWTGPVGHIHKTLYQNYLKDHEAPEDIQYYACGPPAMTASLIEMLQELGVERDHIFFDDFG
ncbi:NADH:ubiquinone reductase (Na(+)-transporting) subunit F [Desulfurivibrio alkaliphilus]|uniref:Na(+)-translocating NADH-quinone reductase subunit F n=1 Tax=Desulfurivibrio alkaliphilus (strain DSM 19089 / UNIQEM U267 / AHT2) TaxID=589865 RepID=D6Z5A4_DESAT|nr:NADH:ubiquinone reductase (Na(+)-transporting) subunit F [Desulfurivibrio alkaliphilus]ADH84761.1 NADH:ubiquinone oxidoreductase, subunit F [Desulfurivibrio alkaliphilus AHT 2]